MNHARPAITSQIPTRNLRPVPTIRITYETCATCPYSIIIGKSLRHPNIRFPYLSDTVENIIPMLHHRKPNRLGGFNYAQNRLYFITTCVHDRICAFGEVVDHQMVLNECGMIADRQWYWLENQYPYVRVHKHIVMPNHVHAIVEINRDLIPIVGTGRDPSNSGTGRDLSLQNPFIRDPFHQSELNIKIKSLSELIGAYKTMSSKTIHLIKAPDGSHPYQSFCWQRSFHDRIIRNHNEYLRIVTYIDHNPSNWSWDKLYR